MSSDGNMLPGRGRPAKFTRDDALSAAMLLFWRKGYAHTSLDDLVASTGASRGSLYKSFGDKRAIFLEALDLYASRFHDRVDETLESAEDARTAMHALLIASATRLGGQDAPPGCLRCNSTLELYGQNSVVDTKLDEINARFLSEMERVIARGVAEGSVDPGQERQLANFFTATVAGLVTFSRSGAKLSALIDCVDVALQAWPSSKT